MEETPLAESRTDAQAASLQALKEELVTRFCRLSAQGMANRFEGNMSARTPEGIIITPSQQSKETMTAGMTVELDADGHRLNENGFAPSSETAMHLALYRLRPDVQAVVHVHSPFATAFALAGQPIEGQLAELHLLFGGSIPCCTYGTPGTDAVFSDFPQYFGQEQRSAVLLANHGLVTVGRNMEEAVSCAEAAEKLAKITLLARVLGPEASLPDGEAERLAARSLLCR